jgi:hypothetical protein
MSIIKQGRYILGGIFAVQNVDVRHEGIHPFVEGAFRIWRRNELRRLADRRDNVLCRHDEGVILRWWRWGYEGVLWLELWWAV